MDSSRWRVVSDIFADAIARSPGERTAWLAEVCAADVEIRDVVERLITAHESARDFLEAPADLRVLEARGLDGAPFQASTLVGAQPPLGISSPASIESSRFAIRRVIGMGGMGIVYEAWDQERGGTVALKTLRRMNPSEVYDLKREFRALSDVSHPNLVSLYELVVDGSQRFFTMELVDGVDVVQALRPLPPAVRFTRMRDVFGQIADGLTTLHCHGRLHRDIKPSNILVTPENRVVILDFGLIAELGSEAAEPRARLAGTPAYMAPEDIDGARATEFSDWYSVGITLYHVLTGRVPFEGPFDEQYRCKTTMDPSEPARLIEGIPEDLNRICMDLIARDPDRRRAGRDSLERFAQSLSSLRPTAIGRSEHDAVFVGRAAELAALDRALDVATSGGASTVLVHGPSGIGKSALVRRFLERRADSAIVVLRGRCYEQEAVPFAALDGMIDSLGHHLNGLPLATRETLRPPDFQALARMFPVLAERHVTRSAPAEGPNLDPVGLRRRGLAALRQLLAALAAHSRVMLFIDDLHWADEDSVSLLGDLLRPPHAPALLACLCFRSEEAASKPFLRALLDKADDNACLSLGLGPLSDAEAGALMKSMGVRTPDSAEYVRVAREAEGNPLLLNQMALYVAGRGTDEEAASTFPAMLRAQLDGQAPEARRFLDALAICGRPTPPQVVFHACGLTGDERPLVASLRSTRLVRSSGSMARVEVYHDRIRSALAAMVRPEQARQIHAALADALVAARFLDPEDLFEHYAGAGDVDRAAVQAAGAADRAADALAFERAAHFYRRALSMTPAVAAAWEWNRNLAQALANAGRPAEAANAYLDAAESCPPSERIDLQRRAGERLLVGGHIDRGLDVIRTVLAAVRVPLRRGPRSAFLSLVLARLRLWRRGLDYLARDERDIPQADLQRIDTCWSVVTGLTMVDPIHAADFQTRHLLLALAAGEPRRVARALALQVIMQAAGHGLSAKSAFVQTDTAMDAASRLGDPHLIALVTVATGLSAAARGEWRRSAEACRRALDILIERCPGATWEINLAQFLFIGPLLYLGEVRDVSGRVPDLIASARERGNLFFETELRTRMSIVWLAADRPGEGVREARLAIEAWAHKGFQRQHYNFVLAEVQTAMYEGDASMAWRTMEDNWPRMKRSFLLRIPPFRIESAFLRARSALLRAQQAPHPGPLLSVVKREISRLRRERLAWPAAAATLLAAGVAFREGRPDLAARDLEAAADAFVRADMHLYVAAARWRLGTLVAGARGRDLQQSANDWMAAQEIKNRPAMVRLLAPGFPN